MKSDKGMTVSSTVQQQFVGYTVLAYLSGRFTYLSAEDWAQRIIEGRVRIGEHIAAAGDILVLKDDVSYDMPDFPEPPCDFNYSIIYEDEWLLGINKTGNLLVHRSGMSFRSNLIHHLRWVRPAGTYPEADIINRLDRETSGVVLVAKSHEALLRLHSSFAKQKIEKEYLAIVEGVPASPEGIIDAAIGKGPEHCRFIVDGENAKAATSRYRVADVFAAGRYSAISVFPETGRTHQIRVHLRHLGCPIVGDSAYGSASDLIPRQALHCLSTGCVHPITKVPLIIAAPLPDDMEHLIQTLRGYK